MISSILMLAPDAVITLVLSSLKPMIWVVIVSWFFVVILTCSSGLIDTVTFPLVSDWLSIMKSSWVSEGFNVRLSLFSNYCEKYQ